MRAQVDPDALASQVKDNDLVQFKLRMDGLKNRLSKGPSQEAQLKKACQDFEAVFISKLWQQMRTTVPKEGYLHSKDEEAYLSMFDKEFSEKLSQGGGIGLGDMMFDQLKKKLAAAGKDTLPGQGTPALTPVKGLPQAPEPAAEASPAAPRSQVQTLAETAPAASPVGPSSVYEPVGPVSTIQGAGLLPPRAVGPGESGRETLARFQELAQAIESRAVAPQQAPALNPAPTPAALSRTQADPAAAPVRAAALRTGVGAYRRMSQAPQATPVAGRDLAGGQ